MCESESDAEVEREDETVRVGGRVMEVIESDRDPVRESDILKVGVPGGVFPVCEWE